LFYWGNTGKRAVLYVNTKKEFCSFGEQIPAASLQNIVNHFSILCDKTIGGRCIGDILVFSKKKIDGKM
jgi:hypothetical protein